METHPLLTRHPNAAPRNPAGKLPDPNSGGNQADPNYRGGANDPNYRGANDPVLANLGAIDFWEAFRESGAAQICFDRIRDLEERLNVPVNVVRGPDRDDPRRRAPGDPTPSGAYTDDLRRAPGDPTGSPADPAHRAPGINPAPVGPSHEVATDPHGRAIGDTTNPNYSGAGDQRRRVSSAPGVNDHEPDRYGNRVGGYGEPHHALAGRIKPRDGQIDTIFREALSSSRTFEIMANKACEALNEQNWEGLGAAGPLVGDRHGNRGTVGNPTTGTADDQVDRGGTLGTGNRGTGDNQAGETVRTVTQ